MNAADKIANRTMTRAEWKALQSWLRKSRRLVTMELGGDPDHPWFSLSI